MINPSTGREYGDHGTGEQAIDFALDVEDGDAATFLNCWRHGELEEWPEFYKWLSKQDKSS